MRLVLHRRYLKETYTIGALSIDGEYFCDTIEDKVRDLPAEAKVYGQTAIPYGRYEVELSLSPKFKRLLPMLMDVKYFTGIRIHAGNSARDSSGCILPGENKKKGMVINSTKYEKLLVKKMKLAIKRGEEISLTII